MEIKEFTLDCARMTDRAAAHEYLAAAPELPEHYGRNLDALHDCLGEMPACEVTLKNAGALSALGEYGDALLSVFCDEAQEREDFRVNLRR